MTNNVRQLARTLRRSAENVGRSTNEGSLRSAVRNDWSRIDTELREHGRATVRDAEGRSYRVERDADQ